MPSGIARVVSGTFRLINAHIARISSAKARRESKLSLRRYRSKPALRKIEGRTEESTSRRYLCLRRIASSLNLSVVISPTNQQTSPQSHPYGIEKKLRNWVREQSHRIRQAYSVLKERPLERLCWLEGPPPEKDSILGNSQTRHPSWLGSH